MTVRVPGVRVDELRGGERIEFDGKYFGEFICANKPRVFPHVTHAGGRERSWTIVVRDAGRSHELAMFPSETVTVLRERK